MACATMSKNYLVGGDEARIYPRSLSSCGKVGCTTDMGSGGVKVDIGTNWSIAMDKSSTVRKCFYFLAIALRMLRKCTA